jgi:hypothetical protein
LGFLFLAYSCSDLFPRIVSILLRSGYSCL